MYKLLVVLSVLFSSAAQILLKVAAQNHYPSFWKQYFNPWVLGGYAILGGCLFLNVYCLAHGVQVKEVSIIESLSYLFVPCLSLAFLNEHLSNRKKLAVVIIMLGIIVFFL